MKIPSNLLRIAGIVLSLALIYAGIRAYAALFTLALDHPTRLAGIWNQYPPKGTLGYYRVCTWEILLTIIENAPLTVGFIFSCLALGQLMGFRALTVRLPAWQGALFCLACCLGLGTAMVTEGKITLERLLINSAFFPAAVSLFHRPSWPGSFFVSSVWSGLLLAGLGIYHEEMPFVLAGSALISLMIMIQWLAKFPQPTDAKSEN